MIGKLLRKTFGEEVWIDMKKLVTHINAHQKVPSAGKEFSNQVGRMTQNGSSYLLDY